MRFVTNKPSEKQKLKRLQMQKAMIESKLQDQEEKLGFIAENQANEDAYQSEMRAEESTPGNSEANAMPVIAQMNSMIINTGGPNLIGNQED